MLQAEDFEQYRHWKSWDAERFGHCDTVEAVYFAAELTRAGVDLGQAQAILEIGFGNGSFAAWAVGRGWSYVGTENDPRLVERARDAGYEAYGPDEGVAGAGDGARYDLIVAFDVLEHLAFEQITALLDTIAGQLAPGGKIIARFPSGDSPFARATQHGDIIHRSIIGSGIVEQIALATGYRVLQIRAPAFPITGLGVRRALRRSAVALMRFVVTGIINLAFHDNRKRVLTANMLIVLDRPRQ